ncbi:hypothetical protein [Klebsiella pneumoniae]|uniref:hypothetical protein n=1 Tax=Klebsiella pneumoniae TaxID=573 RepID=UPI0033080774|nr:hypothetical protein [Klebsiella quasipneumoniae]
MRMGRYTRILWVLVTLSLISFSVHSILPLLARSAIGGVIGRVVASRAAAVAANDAVYLTMVNNTSRAIAVNAASRSALIPSQAMLKSGANVLTWAGVGYSLGQLRNDELLPEGVVIDDKGNYVFKSDDISNTVVAGKELTSKYPYYSYYHEKYYEGFNRHMVAKKVFGDIQLIEGLTCGFPPKACTLSAIISVSDAAFGNVLIEYEGYVKKELVGGSYSIGVSENYDYHSENPSPGESNDKDVGKFISDTLNSLKLDVDKLANVLNSLWMEAASKPDYEGLPFTSSNPVTANEIKAVAPEVINLTQQEWIKPNQIHENSPVEIPVKETGSTTEPNEVFPESPEPDYPYLEMPSAMEILQPFNQFFPEYKNLRLPSRNATCPVWYIPFYGKEYKVDSHCPLLEDNRGVFKAIFLLLWSFISLRKLLSA